MIVKRAQNAGTSIPDLMGLANGTEEKPHKLDFTSVPLPKNPAVHQSTVNAGGSHPYSVNVKNMQNNLLKFSHELAQVSGHLFDSKAKNFNNTGAQTLGIDSNIVATIQALAKKPEQFAAEDYGDGRWGQKTQDALRSVYNLMATIAKYTQNSENGKTIQRMVDMLKSAGADKASWKDIPQESIDESATAISSALEGYYVALSQLNGLNLKDIAAQRQSEAQKTNLSGQNTNQQPNNANGDFMNAALKLVDGQGAPAELRSAFIKKFPAGFTPPFVIGSNKIDFVRIGYFISTIESIMDDHNWQTFIETQSPGVLESMRQNVTSILQYIANLENEMPQGKQRSQIDFDWNDPNRATNFITEYAGGNAGRAHQMLENAAALCKAVEGLLGNLKQIPSLATFIPNVDEQIREADQFAHWTLATNNQPMMNPPT